MKSLILLSKKTNVLHLFVLLTVFSMLVGCLSPEKRAKKAWKNTLEKTRQLMRFSGEEFEEAEKKVDSPNPENRREGRAHLKEGLLGFKKIEGIIGPPRESPPPIYKREKRRKFREKVSRDLDKSNAALREHGGLDGIMNINRKNGPDKNLPESATSWFKEWQNVAWAILGAIALFVAIYFMLRIWVPTAAVAYRAFWSVLFTPFAIVFEILASLLGKGLWRVQKWKKKEEKARKEADENEEALAQVIDSVEYAKEHLEKSADAPAHGVGLVEYDKKLLNDIMAVKQDKKVQKKVRELKWKNGDRLRDKQGRIANDQT